MEDENPLQVALQQLAKTMGLSLPATTSCSVAAGEAVNTSKNGQDMISQEAKEDEEETEEGELSDNQLNSPITSKASKRKPLKQKQQTTTKIPPKKNSNKEVTAPKKRSTLNGVASISPFALAVAKTKPKVPCRYWMEGKCSKDSECTFSHALRPNKTPEEAKSEEVCKFHIAGNCLKGDGCLYSHDLSRVPCKFYHIKGDCAAGVECRFSHAPINDEARKQLTAEMNSISPKDIKSTTEGKSSIISAASIKMPAYHVSSPVPPLPMILDPDCEIQPVWISFFVKIVKRIN